MSQQFFIKELELTDFMKFDHRIFNFAKDLSVIVGRNGSGKSSILEALALSFQVKDRSSSVQDFIRCGKNVAKIKLTCLWLGKPLVIESVFTAKGARRIQRTVEYDGKVFNDTQANQYLLEFFDNRSLTVAFALQGNEKFLTNSKALNLKNLINLLQADFTKEILYVKGQLQTLDTQKTDLLENLNKQKGALVVFDNNLTEYTNRLNNLKNQFNDLQIQDLDTTELEKQLFELKTKLQNLSTQKQGLDQLNKDYQSNQIKLLEAQNSLKDIQTRLTGLETQVEPKDSSAEKQLRDQLSVDIKKFTDDIQKIVQSINEKTQQLTTVNTKKSFEIKRQQQLSNGICPCCQQTVQKDVLLKIDNQLIDYEKTLNGIQSDIETLKVTQSELLTRSAQAQADLKGVEVKIQDITVFNNNIEHNRQLSNILNQNQVNTQKNITDLQTILEKQKEQLSSVVDQGSDIVNLGDQIYKLEQEQDYRKRQTSQKQALQVSISEITNLIDRSRDESSNIKNNVTVIEQQLDQLQKVIANWMQAQVSLNNLSKVYIKSFITELQSACSLLVQQFGYKGLLIESDEKGISFYLQTIPLKDVEKADISYMMCSAFERNLINLSLIYTLSRMFRVPFICIDELDSSADIDNTAQLGELVKVILQYTPVIAVSHSDKLVSLLVQSNFENVILKTNEA